jgi:hypothetical protein
MDVNRLIKIEELEIGDEIITPSGGQLRYYRVLRKPKFTQKPNKYSNGQLVDKWSGTRCSFKADITVDRICIGTRWERDKTYTIYHCTPEDHNVEKMIYGLNYREMWLVKRKDDI